MNATARPRLVDGYTLQQAIHHHETLRNLAQLEFPSSTSAFPGEQKAGPDEVMGRIVAAENAVAALQAALGAYNQQVRVSVGGKRITLAEAIKRVGGASRIEKHWSKAATPDHYASAEREKEKIYAVPRLTTAELQERVISASREAALLRQAIAQANTTKIKISVDPSLLKKA